MLEPLILTTITAAAAVAVGVAAMVISPTVALTTIAVGIITSGGIIYDAKMNSTFNKKITRMEKLNGYNEQYVISEGWKRKWYYTTKERDKILGDCFRTIRLHRKLYYEKGLCGGYAFKEGIYENLYARAHLSPSKTCPLGTLGNRLPWQEMPVTLVEIIDRYRDRPEILTFKPHKVKRTFLTNKIKEFFHERQAIEDVLSSKKIVLELLDLDKAFFDKIDRIRPPNPSVGYHLTEPHFFYEVPEYTAKLDRYLSCIYGPSEYTN